MPRCGGASGLSRGAHGPQRLFWGGTLQTRVRGSQESLSGRGRHLRWISFLPPCIHFSPLFVLGAAHITADPTPRFGATSTHPRGGGEGDEEPRLAPPGEATAAVSRRGPAAAPRVPARAPAPSPAPSPSRVGAELPRAAPPPRRQVALWSQGRRRRRPGCAPRGPGTSRLGPCPPPAAAGERDRAAGRE